MIEFIFIFTQSFLEVLFFLTIVKTINTNANLGVVRVIVYSTILATLATIMDLSQISYHFAFSIIASIALYLVFKRPTRKYIGYYVIDLLISFVILSVIQLIITGIAGLFSVNMVDNGVAIIIVLVGLIALFEKISSIIRLQSFLERHYIPYRITILFAIISVLFLITIVFDLILYSGELFSVETGTDILLVVIGYFVSNLVLGISFIRMNSMSKEKAAALEYGELLQSIVNAYRKSGHNFKHYLQMIINLNENPDGSAKNPELHKYLETIKNDKSYFGDTSIVKDDVLVSAMLHQKKGYAKQQAIDFTVNIAAFLSEYKLPNTDLIDILVVLIDNAFEAVEKLNPENRVVLLDFDENIIEIRNKASVSIVKNSSIKPDRFFDDGYSTKGSDRGFGLSNVLSIAETYDISAYSHQSGPAFASNPTSQSHSFRPLGRIESGHRPQVVRPKAGTSIPSINKSYPASRKTAKAAFLTASAAS